MHKITQFPIILAISIFLATSCTANSDTATISDDANVQVQSSDSSQTDKSNTIPDGNLPDGVLAQMYLSGTNCVDCYYHLDFLDNGTAEYAVGYGLGDSSTLWGPGEILGAGGRYIGAIRREPMSVVRTTWASKAARINWCLID